jgi:hypothetical protein
MDNSADASNSDREELLPLVPNGNAAIDEAVLRDNFITICNAIYGTDFKSIDIVGAVLLTTILRDEPQMYKRYIQERGDNFLEVMENDELLSQIIAAECCGAISEEKEASDGFDPIISGRSPRAIEISPREVRIPLSPRPRHDVAHMPRFEARMAQPAPPAEATVYTNLMTFIDNTIAPERRRELCQLMYNLIDDMRFFIALIPQQGAANIRIYNNIQLVAGELPAGMPRRPAQIFPKFSFNIVCRKEPLLQTVLVAGRENGMGKTLNNFVFTQLQEFFGPDVILKIVEPTESNRLWQVKISIHKNDFVFFTIQIINVKDDFFAGVRPIDPINPIDPQRLAQILQNSALYDTYFQLFENLLFLLYNKSNSKDFNCLCSLSELDIYIFRILSINPANIPLLTNYIRIFLTNLVDAQPNVKKRYFILGLYNLIFCSEQENYTVETRAYRWLFDQPIHRLNVFAGRGQRNKNVFLHAMRLIQQTNDLSITAIGEGQREPIRFVMGGGKQYSLFQKALHRFSSEVASMTFFNQCMQEVVDRIFRQGQLPIDGIEYPRHIKLFKELHHVLVKAAADLDAGVFHEEGVVGSTQCMAVCMLLQVSLKNLINHLMQQGGVYNAYEIDIGNSCIGNPPTTLSSLRMVLNNSILFYDDPNAIIQQLIAQLGINLADISSIISPFDYVPKGSMIQYTKHIIEAVSLFGDIGLGSQDELDTLTQLLSDYCMITAQGFSSPLKGIFDIFYTLFIIENFANRTLVTQKINKELKRISICAQILYLHYSELIHRVDNGEHIIRPMLNILTDMISYGYAGDLLDPRQFNIIMQKYVEFIRKLIEFNGHPQRLLLNYYCVLPPEITRELTETERFFGMLLEKSIDDNTPADLAPLALPGDVSVSLTCIPEAIRSVQLMDIGLLERLCQNKTYAAYRDTENKRNSVVVISIAYQNFLWNTQKRNLIKIGNAIDEAEDNRMFFVDRGNPDMQDPEIDSAIGLLDIFRDNPDFFNGLMVAIEPCYNNPANLDQNLLDISLEKFDDIHINPTLNFQFIFWFLTCIFGIKTKSAVKKIISLARTYLNSIKDNFDFFYDGNTQRQILIFGSTIRFPVLPEPRPARIELQEFPAADIALLQNSNPDDLLFLAYDTYAINRALYVYRTAEANFRDEPDNYVFKIANTIVVRKDSHVLRKDLIERLTESFSKLPRGQAYENLSSAYMGPILHAANRI